MSSKTSLLRGPKQLLAKSRSFAYTSTTGTALCSVPAGARLIGAFFTGTAANTATTAQVKIGTTAANSDELATANVLATGTAPVGSGGFVPFDVTANTVLTAPTKIYALYSESGGTSNAGSWIITIVFTTGNDIADDNA